MTGSFAVDLLRRVILVASVVALSSIEAADSKGAQVNSSVTPIGEVLYKASSGHRVDVFDLTKRYVFIEGDDYLARRDGRHQTEFAGPILYCTNAKYFCIRGGISAVVPRTLNRQTEWIFAHVACRSTDGLTQTGINRVTCTFRGATTEFAYERERGIVRYMRQGSGEPEFLLVGDHGLFATPNAAPSR